MKKIILTVALAMFAVNASYAQNPFEVQGMNQYEGVFASNDMKLRIYKKNGALIGNLFRLNENIPYPIKARIENHILIGTFGVNNKKFDFSLASRDNKFFFKAGSKTSTMIKLPRVDFENTWEAENIKVVLEKASGNKYHGFIFKNGQKYIFNGEIDGITITGHFSQQRFPVILMQDLKENKIKFSTGEYSKTLIGQKSFENCFLGELPYGIIIGRTFHSEINAEKCLEKKDGICIKHSLDGSDNFYVTLNDSQCVDKMVLFETNWNKWEDKGLIFFENYNKGLYLKEFLDLIKKLPISKLQKEEDFVTSDMKQTKVSFNLNNTKYLFIIQEDPTANTGDNKYDQGIVKLTITKK